MEAGLDRSMVGFLDSGTLNGMLADLQHNWADLAEAQRKVLMVTGIAWSDDRMIRAEVGPRGQLVRLEINPRLLRSPDSVGLAEAIVATSRRAVADAMARCAAIIDEAMRSDLRAAAGDVDGGMSLATLMHRHDGDLLAAEGERDG